MGDSVVGGSKVLTSEPILLRASDIFSNFILLRAHKISNSVVLNKPESNLYQLSTKMWSPWFKCGLTWN